MKFTPRMKRAVRQSLVINIIFIVILSVIALLIIVPNFKEIEEKKQELSDSREKFEKVKKYGISLWTLKSSVNQTQENDFAKAILADITKQEYENMLSNTGAWDFEMYLWELWEKTTVRKQSEEFLEQEERIEKVLPIYSESQKQWLTDHDFISYVERLLYSFNVSSKWEIGIGNLTSVKNQDSIEWEVNLLAENIFYIPLNFEIEWQKKDVFNLMHFAENVGSATIEDNVLRFYSDKKFRQTLEWDSFSPTYNIYENQLVDISFVSLDDYPDSSTFWSERSLLELIDDEQARERYSAEVELRFYVSGLPGYQLELYIEDVLEKYQTLALGVESDIATYSNNSSKYWIEELRSLESLKSLTVLFILLEPVVTTLREEIAIETKLESIYDDIVNLDQQLERVQQKYDAIISELSK